MLISFLYRFPLFIKFILYLTNDFLHYVLKRHKPGRTAVFIDQNSDLGLSHLHQLQQRANLH
ncbi:hypothetical protein D3C87_2188910 [compost metagenome]